MGNNNMHRKVLVDAKLQKKDVRIDSTDVALIRGAGHGYRINEFQASRKVDSPGRKSCIFILSWTKCFVFVCKDPLWGEKGFRQRDRSVFSEID